MFPMFHKLMHHPFMDRLRSPRCADVAKLILRLAIGAIFMNHGHAKLFGGLGMTSGYFEQIGIPMAGFFAVFIGCLEFFGGLLLMLGLGTRLFGALFACDMLVAIGAAFSWRLDKSGLELMLGAASLSLFFSDAGAYSLDAWLMKKSRKEHEAALPMAPKA